MNEANLCINCEHVKILDKIVGRCMAHKGTGIQFCRLEEPPHVCEKYKRSKDEDKNI